MSAITDFIKKYLLPYDRHITVIDINDAAAVSGTDVAEDTFHWIGGDPFCEKVKWIPIDPSCEISLTKWIGEEVTAYCEGDSVSWEGIDVICKQ